jgi:hypothetical protein
VLLEQLELQVPQVPQVKLVQRALLEQLEPQVPQV